MITSFVLTILIVGVVKAGLKIRFDRFFVIILLLFLLGKNINQSVDIFLWVIVLGAASILLQNRLEISKMESDKKKKMFIFIPVMTFIFAGIGSYLFSIASANILIMTLAVLAFLYGLRLTFLHFKEHELNYQNEKPGYVKLCGLAGPVISGLSLGFIGSSLKSLKIPFGVKLGKMNIKQVYFGNTVTAFFASGFAIAWHGILTSTPNKELFANFMLGASLWVGVHYIYEFTDIFFPDKWRKPFQIIVGLALLVASVKIIGLMQ